MANTGKKHPPLVAPRRQFRKASARAGSLASGLALRLLPGHKRRTKANATRGKPIGNILTRTVRYILGGTLRMLWWISLRTATLGALVVGGWTAYYYAGLPDDARTLMDGRTRGSVEIRDRNGQVFAWRGDQFGGMVNVNTVAPQLKNAVVAAEDKRFYRHIGLSPRGIAGAIRTNMREGRHPLRGHGGSTITQQVAKRVFFPDLGMIERKLREVPMSLALELKYTKDEILNIYMNRAYLGAGSHGFEAAAQRYFSKSASDVSVPEAAMLAGLLKAPSATAPTRNMEAAQNRANLIISLMEAQGYLTTAQADTARANPAQLSDAAKRRVGDYFADWLMEHEKTFAGDLAADYTVGTTFDPRIQKAAEEALAHIFETRVKKGSEAQAAIVVLSNDGAVRAIVGGRKSGLAGQFSRATQARRQTGSSFKPFIYAAALNEGWNPEIRVMDEPITLNIPGSGKWSPRNYRDEYLGEISVTEALARSVNTVAVKVSEAVGRERVKAVATGFGVASEIADGPAIALGASEASLLEMTGAYAGILNGGRATPPYGVIYFAIRGDSTRFMERSSSDGGNGEQIVSEKAAGQLVYMMHQVVMAGSGARARIPGVEVAGKTGTTNAARDAWFIGFTSDYVVGVWMGYDDNRKLTGVTGSGLPADIWRETVVRIINGAIPAPLPMVRPTDALPGMAEHTETSQDVAGNFAGQAGQDPADTEQEAENVINRLLKSIFR
ncbi:MAG: PBP1A family penicillin-binding protein [Rhodobacteraceae bacterium]|nr:PBP1A family penicillin-binding protein [Paracoccaceae bacterium]